MGQSVGVICTGEGVLVVGRERRRNSLKSVSYNSGRSTIVIMSE